jgi:hypothetical protein
VRLPGKISGLVRKKMIDGLQKINQKFLPSSFTTNFHPYLRNFFQKLEVFSVRSSALGSYSMIDARKIVDVII